MKYLETEHERKSFIITTIIFVIILILCFFLGMKYMDPPPENGIAINFGTTEFGSGEIQPDEPIASAPQVQAASQSTPVVDQVATQEVNDAPVIQNEKPKKEQPKEDVKPKEVPKPTPSKSTTDALNSILNGPKSDGKATGGQGDDNKAGDAGDPNGDRNANGDGRGDGKGAGRGTGVGNYQLAGRKVLTKPQPRYICNEQGIVAVEISVDQNGRVISANPGVRGTTNSAKCLLDQAKQAAMNTKFDSSDSAPEKQVGKIIYNFKLTE